MIDVNQPKFPSIAQVNAAARLVGLSYGQFVAAGLPVPADLISPPKAGRRKIVVDAEIFMALYVQGYTDVAIAQQMGVSYGAIGYHRRMHGLPPNKRA